MYLFFRAQIFFWRERIRALRFYRRPLYALSDLSLGLLYIFSNPFRISRRFMQNLGEEQIHAYGETPLLLWSKIAQIAGIGPHDCFMDLGCGRGRLCFWLAHWIGCKAVGVEWNPAFVRRASWLSTLLRLRGVSFLRSRILNAPIEKASVLYLYTFHPDEERLDWSRLKEGARVITVSQKLDDPRFSLEGSLDASFAWGNAKVFIQRFSKTH